MAGWQCPLVRAGLGLPERVVVELKAHGRSILALTNVAVGPSLADKIHRQKCFRRASSAKELRSMFFSESVADMVRRQNCCRRDFPVEQPSLDVDCPPQLCRVALSLGAPTLSLLMLPCHPTQLL